MADIELYEDDSEDTIESDTAVGFEDYDSDPCDPDAGLSMLQRLEKYCKDENMYTRHMVTRSLLETIRTIENEEGTDVLLHSLVTLADDPEPMVRSELMEHIPHVAIYCQENSHIFGDPLPSHLLPIVVKYITDINNTVRKTSQAALLVLLEQDMIKRDDVVEQVCPVILELSHPESMEDFRIEAVALMSKLAPLVGKNASEHIFMDRFAEMCTDPLFSVRKVCATNFGDFCQVVGQDNAEKVLLPKFYYLCEDGVWGVRKACAECFMQVSCVCSIHVRRSELAQLFVNLICDQSRWVRMASFQALGGFISTFADPRNTGLYFNDDGVLVVGERESFKKKKTENNVDKQYDNHSSAKPAGDGSSEEMSSETDSSASCERDACDAFKQIQLNTPELDASTGVDYVSNQEKNGANLCADAGIDNNNGISESIKCVESDSIGAQVSSFHKISGAVKKEEAHILLENNNTMFNTFQFWRMPLPDIDVDPVVRKDPNDGHTNDTLVYNEKSEIDDKKHLSDTVNEEMDIDTKISPSEQEKTLTIHTASVSTVCETVEEVANIGSTHILGHHVNESTLCLGEANKQAKQQSNVLSTKQVDTSVSGDADTDGDDVLQHIPADQNVIPQALLDHYLSMTDPSRAQTVDSEIAKHCAYSLPAVAYTLGRDYWPCLKDLYESLAGDMQWKVRRTLAFSIHELAVIVGGDITARDLVPVFNGFLKDLDEVRIGVLKHLGDFLKLLLPDMRRDYLTKIYEFLNTDNTRNWRFREELATQLNSLLDLYTPTDITDHLVPIAFMLAEDSVAAVRNSAFKVLSSMIGCLTSSGDNKQLSTLLHDVTERFTHSPRWSNRQIYVHICQNILAENSMPQDVFAADMLPTLLSLVSDPIPNVRIALSRALACHILNSEFFTSSKNPNHSLLLETIQVLQTDIDRDVRHFLQSHNSQNMLGDTIPV